MTSEIRIYVACLAAYNGSRLHGVWIDATGELDEIQEQVNVMLKEPLIKSHNLWQRQKPVSRRGHAVRLIAFQMATTQIPAFWLSPAGQGYRASSLLLHFW